jgi:DNA-binding LytR/AlgR family response regulator
MGGDERVLSWEVEEPVTPLQSLVAPPAECRCQGLRLLGERAHRLYFIAVCDVDYIEAYGNYVRIHVGDCEYLRRDTLARLSRELCALGFQMVRRSTLLNLRRVAFAERQGGGALAFTLASGATLVSRTRFRLKEWP